MYDVYFNWNEIKLVQQKYKLNAIAKL